MIPTTNAMRVAEILKCGKNPIYFMNEYCKITHPQQGIIPFKTYPFQDDCVRDFIKHRFNIILKSRQLGLSTVTAAYSVWMALFHKEKNILVIATKLPTAVNFIKKVKTILNSLPQWLRISTFDGTNQEVRFKNGSSVKAIPTSEDAGRSEALSLLIVDEAAWVRNFEEIWTGLAPTLSTGGAAIVLSTPNGVGGQYYKLYIDAEAKNNEFNPIKLLWNVHPEHDDEWFAKETRQFSRRKISQEFLCQFLGSGDTYISGEDITWLESIARPPLTTGDGVVERDIWIWAQPTFGHKYILSADVARGDAKDFSTFHIIDTNTRDVVAEFRGKTAPDRLAVVIDRWGRKYNNAYVCPENNTFGYTTCMKLKELKYPKLIYQKARPTQWDSFIATEDDLVGFSTQAKSKELALSKFEEMIRNKTVRSYSTRLVNELRTFIWYNNRAVTMKDEHDDLIMSLAINCWLFDSAFGGAVQDSFDATTMLKCFSKSSTKFNTVPGSGHDMVPAYKQTMLPHNVFRPQTPTGAMANDDFKWLLK